MHRSVEQDDESRRRMNETEELNGPLGIVKRCEEGTDNRWLYRTQDPY